MASEIVKVETDTGTVELSGDVIRRTLCDNQNVTDREVELFIGLCKAQRLNPFVKEAHIVKYGDGPATMVVGKDVFTKRAQRNPRFKGLQAGLTFASHGKLGRREGSMLLPGEQVIGGWCTVYVDGYKEPMYDEVSFDEYAGRKRDGSLNSQWASKPGTMIRKVAVVHALREAFPDDLGGLYDAVEMGVACDAQEVACEVEDVPDDPEPAEDPRKALWEDVAALKRAALELGTSEEGITSWMQANIRRDDGGAKPPNEYSPEDVARLRSFLEDNIADHEQMAAEQMEAECLDLADHDIEF